jgi:hypothetical protein
MVFHPKGHATIFGDAWGYFVGRMSEEVDAKFKAAAKVTSGYTWASRIYTCLDREIRWASV